MEIHIHIEKKHIYALIAVLVLAFGTIFVFAGHGNRIPPNIPTPVVGVFHYLQNVVKSDALDTVDSDNNGVIDSSDSCGIDPTDDVCDVNTLKLTPRAAAPLSPDNTIWYQT